MKQITDIFDKIYFTINNSNKKMSFLFNCCKEDPSKKPQYQVERREGNQIITEYVTADQLKNKSGQILRVNRSEYD